MLSYGFRPFFLLAGSWAAIALLLWMADLLGFVLLPTAFDPVSWHSHEMLFGFAAAAVAGFVLTAVPNWTGRLPLQGRPLLFLVGLWLAGRVAVTTSAIIGGWTAAVVDVAFLAVLLAAVAHEIVAGRNWRNLPIVAALAVLCGANVAFHIGALTTHGTAAAARLAIAVLIVLICLIGGRIIPSFTRNWLAKRGQGRLPASFNGFDKIALAVTLTAMACWTYEPQSSLTGVAAAAAAACNLARLARWAGERTTPEPLLWILHVAFLWVPVGLALLAITAFGGAVPPSAGLHALTGGAIASMILAVMTRATLGHTGHDLHAGPSTTVIYLLVLVAGISRVWASLEPQLFTPLLITSALAWVAAFGVFLGVFGPVLVRPRVRQVL
ncbi:NnrS family protein [Defluviicoccus vanus]|uniref:NnrS family protein n=1 Tax=Defluviicoccus vanus TaxID=111831 RepID=UPI0021D78FAC|nr:NnrS family protein [Defluviicoccus vanus]